MSRPYNMYLSLDLSYMVSPDELLYPKGEDSVSFQRDFQIAKEVFEQEWVIEDSSNLFLTGDHALCGGEMEEEFVTRITELIWKSAGHFIPVCISATDLGDLPFESYSSSEKDYELFLQSKTD